MVMGRYGWGLGLAAAVAVSSAAPARALPVAPSSCFNDTDCPGAECGGMVCNWNMLAPYPQPDKPYLCVPAGTDPKGMDGWCTSTNRDDDCKCQALGAKCVGVHCSFTRAE